jgi:hypothetical protein
MNTHKIEINFKINEILAVDSNSDIIEIKNLKQLEMILKQNIKMKNKLLKIRNEMSRNDQDIGYTKILKKTEKKKGQGSRIQNNKIQTNSNSSNKLCKLNESYHHRRLITYNDLDASFYTLNEESMLLYNNNKLCEKNFYESKQDKIKLKNEHKYKKTHGGNAYFKKDLNKNKPRLNKENSGDSIALRQLEKELNERLNKLDLNFEKRLEINRQTAKFNYARYIKSISRIDQ